ncbi:alpha/beta hydrolase [Alphaproteobacteria bacterium]|jgi:acetyl esterase|nr:alpha/beta hydrolase [Alphaproteobacteria bacterium]MDB2684292.1 alpha/beta hydrolase [Alphaproteobacteria bacterium]MDC1035753.1 alpha/beta hydrolase [Alphaproteobacteria bacterium]
MQIDKDTKALIDERKKNNAPPLESFTPQELRALRAKMAETPAELQVNISNVDDFYLKGSLGPIKVRKYSNNLSKEPDKKNPLIIYFHGGGFVMGDLESHDLVCRHLCKETEATIIAVDYKLAPENKFPASITDTKDAIAEIIKDADNLQIDKEKVILCGDSAGGALAAVGTIMSRDKIVPKIHGQILVYPWVDLTMCRKSMDIDIEGMILNKDTIKYFADHYLNSYEEQVDWRASPILTPDLSNLPPTYIFGAGLDPLVDEGDAYKRRLLSFGNEVHYRLFPGQMHAFLSNSVQLPTALICLKEMGEAAKNIFSKL